MKWENEKEYSWYKLLRNSLISIACFAGVAGTLKIVDHIHHDNEHDTHLEKMNQYKPQVYKEIKIVKLDGDSIIAYIPISNDSSKIVQFP